MKNIKIVILMMIVGMAFLSGCATTKEDQNVSGTLSENVVTPTESVKAVNKKTRHVMLQRDDGLLVKFYAHENVRNLAQVKVGDHVKVAYYQSLAYEVKKPGTTTPGVAVTEGTGRAKPGEKPAAAAVQTLTITATIVAIDKAAMEVTLKSPKGNLTTVKARDPEKLDRVSVGDLVEVTYTEALAISVETPK
jgi:hypothetical protein